MPDLLWLADLGRASAGALWIPVLAWTAVALLGEGALRLVRPGAALALPVRGALLAALPLAVAVPAVLAAVAPEAAVRAIVPDPLVWLPELTVGAPAAPVSGAPAPPAGPPVLDVLLGLGVVAAAGAALVQALRLGAAAAAAARARRTLPPANADAQAAVDAARQRLGVGRTVAAAVAPPGAAPFTLGWRRPLVALPADLNGEARDLAALHEIAHVRRADAAWHAAQRLLTALFAAHPLVWALGRGLDLDRERAADAAVLAARPDRRRAYADLLFSYAALPAPALALGAARGSSTLKTRIDAMAHPLSTAATRQLALAGRLAGLVALVAVLGGAAATALPTPVRAGPVEGRVTDAATGEGIPMASLQVVGTSVGAATDLDGNYRLDAPDGDRTLRVTAQGYAPREVALSAGVTRLDVALTPGDGAARPAGPGMDDPEVFEIVEEMPQLIGGLEGLQERIEYPPLQARAGVEGRAVVQFVVDEAGRVTRPQVIRSSGNDGLDRAALAAVRASEFEPGRQRGRVVKVRFAVPVTFRLGDGDDLGALDAPPGRVGAGDPEVFEVAEVQPQLIGGLAGLQARVEYPPLAREAGIEGVVVVQFVVDEAGRVEDARVLRSPDDLLAEAALRAVRASEFEPGQQRGQAVKVRFAVPITFRLAPEAGEERP